MWILQISLTENQISPRYRYIENIHSMRKPVISSENSPKFDGVPTTDTLPLNQLSEMTK